MQRLILRGLIFLLALACAASLAHVLAALPLRISLDPNEGWNAYHALAARTGGALYPPADSFFLNNYPPLSFYIVGGLGWVLGDDIFAGRILSLVSLGVVLAGVLAVLRILRCGWLSAVFGALFLLSGLLVFSDYVGIDDPQMLGHAIGMGALVLVLRSSGRSRRLIGAGVLCALAFFVKHNLIVLPLALGLWLSWITPRSARLFALAYAMGLAAGLFACGLMLHVNLLAVLANARSYSASLLGANLATWLGFGLVPLLILSILIWRADRRDEGTGLCAIYAAVGFLAGTYFLGGAGVDMNAMFDADIALALAAGLALERLPRLIAAFIAMPLVFGLIIDYDPAWLTSSFWLHPYAEERVSAAADIAFLKNRPGPALCETLALCYWAGKPAAVDVFNLGEAYKQGARPLRDLEKLIATRHFEAIEFETLAPFALGPRVATALKAAYRMDHEDDNGAFFVPN